MNRRKHSELGGSALGVAVAIFLVSGCDSGSDVSSSELEPLIAVTAVERWNGGIDGEPGAILLRGPPSNGVIGPDDVRLVVDGSAARLLILDGEGNVRLDIARPGDGPGEFRSIARAGFSGDSALWVIDPMLNRITLITRDGQFVRTVPMPQGEITGMSGTIRVSDVLSSGAFLGSRTSAGTVVTGDERPEPVPLVLMSDEGEVHLVDWLDGAPGILRMLSPNEPRPFTTTHPIRAAPIVGIPAGGAWWFALERIPPDVGDEGDATIRIRRYDPVGELLDQVEIGYVPQPMTDEVRAWLEGWAEMFASATPFERDDLLRAFWQPTYMPPVRVVLADELGYWIQREQTRPGIWERYDLRGVLLHRLRMPDRFNGIAGSPDAILGWELGALDVPILKEFSIVPMVARTE